MFSEHDCLFPGPEDVEPWPLQAFHRFQNLQQDEQALRLPFKRCSQSRGPAKHRQCGHTSLARIVSRYMDRLTLAP